MKKLITLSLLILTLSGCADRAWTQLGSEAIVFQELHHFVIQPKKIGNKEDIEDQINRIIVSFEPGFEQTFWTLSFRTKSDEIWIKLIEQKLLNRGLISSRIRIEALVSGNTSIGIRVGQYKVKTQTCRRSIVSKMSSDMSCFVDSMRIKHVRDPQSLVSKRSK